MCNKYDEETYRIEQAHLGNPINEDNLRYLNDFKYKTLEKFFKIKEMQKYINAYKIIWNICRYDEKSKYNIKNLNRTVWKKQPIYNIPYNTMLYEASMEGQLAELLLRIRTMKTDDENVNLLKQAKELSEGILVRYKELRMRM